MPSNGERDQFLQQLRDKGVETRLSRNGHWKLYYRNRFIGVLGFSPSSYRWRANTIAMIRRGGVKWP